VPRAVGKLAREYDPPRNEEDILRFWKTNRSYQKTKKKLLGKPKFYFLDGPPYVTAAPHVGTAWNKTLKDVVIRFWRMKGYNVRDQPGFDCHGLPIEVMVEKSLKLTSKKDIEAVVGIDHFIEECRKYASENVKAQTEVFRDLGVWMDWENPYITYQDSYIESVWWTIKKAHEKGLLSKGIKVVYWCPRDETALSGYEVTDEYRIVEDHSIYVKMPLAERPGEFILIWTTTPWTLPANLGVMVHPDHLYAELEVDGDKIILAKERIANVLGDRSYKILREFKGRDLEGIRYTPPLLEETKAKTGDALYKILLSSEYVSMTEGTGAVHMAPGHGEEDFEVGRQNGLPVLSPVDPSGRFTVDAGKYVGLFVRDANPIIIDDLRAKGLIWKEQIIEHSYPHCWRCKTALILRATDQWFVKVTAFKEKMIRENQKVRWVPAWAGSKRFQDWLKGARDWVISRQRYWGAPIPVWTCEACGNHTIIGSKSELRRLAINAPKTFELHRNGVDTIKIRCKCGSSANRERDIIDVWMDSGVASWADLGYPADSQDLKQWWPADFIVEGPDQTRGWFYSQLGSSMVVFNKVPYKTVLMHGWTLDERGETMSKSKGNFVAPGDAVSKFGRDSLRLYTLQSTVWEDFRFSWTSLESTSKDLLIAWNVFSFAMLYLNLDKFTPARWPVRKLWGHLSPEDKWLVSRTENLKLMLTRNMDNLEIHLAARLLKEFVIEDLSHWYVRLVRRRFWLERNSKDKLAAYGTLYHALRNWLILAAPFVPFLTERIYQDAVRGTEPSGSESIHMLQWPIAEKRWINKKLEQEMTIAQQISSAVASARQSKKIRLRQPVLRILVVTDNPLVRRALKTLRNLLLLQVNSKTIQTVSLSEEERLKKLTVEPNFKRIGPAFKGEANLVAEALRSQEGRQVFRAMEDSGQFLLKAHNNEFRITSDMVTFREEVPENFAAGNFGEGRVYVDLTIPKELAREGLMRDVIRRLQEMRKRLDLPVDAFVNAFVSIGDPEMLEWLEDEKDYIMEEVRAKSLLLLRPDQSRPRAGLEAEWHIEGHKFRMGISQKQ